MDLTKRIAELPPEKRDFLMRQLKAQQRGAARPGFGLPRLVTDREDVGAPFPLTDIQQIYWAGRSGLFELGACGSNVYTEYEIVVDDAEKVAPFVARFDQALQQMIQRYDMLRMVVLPDGRQRILPEVPPYTMRVVDLRGLDEAAIEAALAAARERMTGVQAPMHRWPLFEFMAHRLEDCRLLIHIRVDALLTDGTSRKIFLLDLFRYLAAPEAQLPPLGCTYRDYALTWARLPESDLYRRSKEYWLDRLPTLPAAPELPLAQPLRPESPSRFVSRVRQLLDPAAWGRLKARGARMGLTPSGVVISAYAEVMAMWSRAPRFTISLIGSFRPPLHPDMVNLVGNFNTIHLLEVDQGPGSFAARVRQLQEQMTRDLDHLYFSGPQVLRELNRLRRNGARAGAPILFNSVIEYSHPSYHRHLTGGGSVGGSSSTYEEIDLGLYIPQALIMPNALEREDGSLYGKWYAVEEMFPDGMMEDMFEAYTHLLRRLANDEASWEESRYQTVERILPLQQAQQLRAINATETAVSTETLYSLFAAQVARQPDRPALIAGDRRLTYAELHRQASLVSRRLRALGVGRGAVVAVVMEPGWEQIAAVLGVLQAGAAYLPLDARQPPERIARVLEDGEVQVALTQPWLDDRRIWSAVARRLDVGADGGAQSDAMPDDSASGASACLDDLAYVVFTSGATGQPKGVMIDHRAAVNTILDINRRFDIGADDRLLALSPCHVDLSVYDIFGALAAGAAIVVPARDAVDDPAHWLALLRQEHVTLWNSPPALLARLVDHCAERGARLPEHLRLALISRDRAPLSLPDRLRALSADLKLVHLGGATEAAIWSCVHPVHEIDPSWKSIPYGRPMANQRLYVLGEAMEPRPVWVPGDLYIGGLGLAQGYWRDDEATRRHFVAHPVTGERLVATGDVARLLPNGQLELLGRRDDARVEAYGYSVEPRQIEAALERHPAIQQAIVQAQEHAGARRLVAYVVPKLEDRGLKIEDSGPSADESPSSILYSLSSELGAFLQETLPEYMLPETFVIRSALPLTPAGQVDRGALSALGVVIPELSEDVIASEDGLEGQLRLIWEELLETQPIEDTNNFFELGGTSVQMVRLLNRLQEMFGALRIPPTYWHTPTIRNLARILRRRSPAPALLAASADLAPQERSTR